MTKATAAKIHIYQNRELTDEDGTDIACNLGNYGVIYNYKISVTKQTVTNRGISHTALPHLQIMLYISKTVTEML